MGEVQPAAEGFKGAWEKVKKVVEAKPSPLTASQAIKAIEQYDENWGVIVGSASKLRAATKEAEEEKKRLAEERDAVRREAVSKEELLNAREANMVERKKELEERKREQQERKKELDEFASKLTIQQGRLDTTTARLETVSTRAEDVEAGRADSEVVRLRRQLELAQDAKAGADKKAADWLKGFGMIRGDWEKACEQIAALRAQNATLQEEKEQLQGSLDEANIRLDEGRRVRTADELAARGQSELRLNWRS